MLAKSRIPFDGPIEPGVYIPLPQIPLFNPAVAIRTFPRTSVACLPMFAMRHLGQAVNALFGLDDDASTISAVTAVSTVRPTQRDKFLAAKTDTAVAAVPRGHLEGHFIDEVHARAYVARPRRANDLGLEEIAPTRTLRGCHGLGPRKRRP